MNLVYQFQIMSRLFAKTTQCPSNGELIEVLFFSFTITNVSSMQVLFFIYYIKNVSNVVIKKFIPVIVIVGCNSFRFLASHCKLKGQLCTGLCLKGMCKGSKAIERKRCDIRLVFKCLMIDTSSSCSPAVTDEKKYLHIFQRKCMIYSLTNTVHFN